MSVENLVDQLDEMLENAISLPLTSGKVVMDSEKVRRILEDIRLNLPKDIRSAAMIVNDRTQILADAKKEADGIIRQAEERARLMVSRDEITRQAREQADAMLAKNHAQCAEYLKTVKGYVDDLMQRTEEALAASVTELRQKRQTVKASQQNIDNTISN